jgi:putative zinc finger protein
MSHVDDGQVHAYLDGELPQADAWRFEAHVAECPACRGRLEEARALITRASELLALAGPPARDIPPFRAGEVRPPARPSWRVPQPLAWAASVVLALAAGWYLRGTPATAPPHDRGAVAKAAAAADTAATAVATRSPEAKTRGRQEADNAAPTLADAQRDQTISSSAAPNRQVTPVDQAARENRAAAAPVAARVTPAPPPPPPLARWETIPWDTARTILGAEPVRIPDVPALAKRSASVDGVVLIEQQLESGTAIRLYERPAVAPAPGANEAAAAREQPEVRGFLAQRVDGSERLARYVGSLRVEIEGALPLDSLSRLLELVR